VNKESDLSSLAESFDEYTYEDYEGFPSSSRCEIIDGIVYMMSSPGGWHQDMVLNIGRKLGDYLDGKKCRVRIAPFDVRLFPKEDKSDRVVVQPDVIIVCDSDKLSDDKACKGVPDVIIEVVSDSTKSHDMGVKKELYTRAGVKQYLIVGRNYVYSFVRSDIGEYKMDKIYREGDGANVYIESIDFNIVI